MSSRQLLAGVALATILSCPAYAQIEDSGLDQVDPWGISYLSDDEPSLRIRMWRGARTEDLLPLLQAARTSGLTPAEHDLMRRLVLSPARAPVGDEDETLLAERARIAFELGEAAAAAGQLTALRTPPPDMDPAAMAADLNLILGNDATACSDLTAPGRDGEYWAKLRAVCAALAGNTSGAELAIEMAQSQGVKDSWLAGAVFATSGAMPNPPKAKFDNGLDFAMSNRAVLEVLPEAVPQDRPDIAAAMARRKLMPPDVRVRAADVAIEAGLISPEEYRIAYNSALSADGFVARTDLDDAVLTASDVMSSETEKARALATALKAAEGNVVRYNAAAELLDSYIVRLTLNDETAEYALDFARAGVAAGDFGDARRWVAPPEPEIVPVVPPVTEGTETAPGDGTELPAPDADAALTNNEETTGEGESGPMRLVAEGDTDSLGLEDPAADAAADPATLPEDAEPETPPEPEPPSFETAWIEALIVLADKDADTDTVNAAARMLIAAAGTEEEDAEATRLLSLWAAAGIAPPSDARYYLSATSETAPQSPVTGKALAVLAAAHSGTAAEVVLSALSLTDGDPSKLDLPDIAIVLAALREVGAEDAARALAFEASGYWKPRK